MLRRGHVAEWLRNGLQNRVPRFNSGRGLQHLATPLHPRVPLESRFESVSHELAPRDDPERRPPATRSRRDRRFMKSPSRRKPSAKPRKRLTSAQPPSPRSQPGPETLAWTAPDQTGEQIRAMHEERAQRGFTVATSGSQGRLPPLAPGAVPSASTAIKLEASDLVVGSVRTNRIAIVLSVALSRS